MYTLYHQTGPNTTTNDPKVAIAHGKARGHRLTTPDAASRMPPLPRLRLPGLKDQPAETVYQALATSIAKANTDTPASQYEGHHGKVDTDGYWLAATDGHRALMRAGDATERAELASAHTFTPGPIQFVLQRPFADVWRRMHVLADGWIDLELSGCSACTGTKGPHTSIMLTLSARDTDGDTATEIYPLGYCSLAVGIAEPIRFRLNPAYVAPLLRFWPITVAYRPPDVDQETDPPLVWSPAGAGWRYLLMPMRK